ncbi:MAG: glycosidase [Ignavibacteriales bacterium]|nr:glycosidase [Ignavibacteriales bacterium]
MNNPYIYEINTRVWLNNFTKTQTKAKITDVPISYWKSLKNLGIDYIWLMGVWKTCKTTIKKYCLTDELISEYKKALPDYTADDVIGSPYSVDKYIFDPQIGTKEDFIKFKSMINKLGIKLILDFIPNHFSAETVLLKSKPSIFLKGNNYLINKDRNTYFEAFSKGDLIFAHGRDPYFPAWSDTVQINYFDNQSREFMCNELFKISEFCDGVRCDMAMLVLNDVFEKTWYEVLLQQNYFKPENEFWELAITKVKKRNPNFVFIGEVYWDLEWKLQELGFDFTYDKKLYDRLIKSNPTKIKEHLFAKEGYQKRSLRFIENHDEKRAIKSLGVEKSKAAAVIISTIKGAKLFLDGQFEGKTAKLPLQLKREPVERTDNEIKEFYNRLLNITRNHIFKEGKWKLLKAYSINEEDETSKNILAWLWEYGNKEILVAVNYSEVKSKCIIRNEFNYDAEKIEFNDLLNLNIYVREKFDLNNYGLYIELDNYQSHIFFIKKRV